MALMEAGTYPGTTVAASIYEAPSGAVMCSMVVDVGGSHLKGGICLVQKDGTLSERGFKDAQEIFGWSDWDWGKWDVEPESFAGFAVQVKVEVEQGERGEYSVIKYINPAGGGQRLEKANAKALAAKYGAKTRALFGGSPAAAAKPAAAARPSAPRAAPPPPAPPANLKPSTMEACWDAFCKEHPGKAERELYAKWAQEITRLTGKGQNDCTPEDWGVVLVDFSKGMLPF
jgi:hypothetical protein